MRNGKKLNLKINRFILGNGLKTEMLYRVAGKLCILMDPGMRVGSSTTNIVVLGSILTVMAVFTVDSGEMA